MRQAIFVVVMVGAAFLGGAVVNGPGLHWVQARLLDYMGLQDGGEITSMNLPKASLDPADSRRLESVPVATQPSSQIKAPSTESQAVKQNPTNSPAVGSGRPRSSTLPSSAVPPPLPLPLTIPEPAASKPAKSRDKSSQRQAGSVSEPRSQSLPRTTQGSNVSSNPKRLSSASPSLGPPVESGKADLTSGVSGINPASGPSLRPLIPVWARHCWPPACLPWPSLVVWSRARLLRFLWKFRHPWLDHQHPLCPRQRL